MPSKAQGLSLNTIIIAAIVLIVLLILVGMTTGYFGKWKLNFGKVTETSCAGQGGTPKTDCDDATETEVFSDDAGVGKKCCLYKSCTDYSNHGCYSNCGGKWPESCLDSSCGGKRCCTTAPSPRIC